MIPRIPILLSVLPLITSVLAQDVSPSPALPASRRLLPIPTAVALPASTRAAQIASFRERRMVPPPTADSVVKGCGDGDCGVSGGEAQPSSSRSLTVQIAAAAQPAQVSSPHTATPTPTLAPHLLKRCASGDCGGPGGESTLSASVVTTTIVSTTSVPCYITTYVTDSQTITSTVYSTQIITSTMTKEGTVYIIQYSPTPVLMSTLVESVVEVTNTWWSYWLTSGGSAYQITSKGEEKTITGPAESTWSTGGDVSSWTTSANVGGEGGVGTAWTHVTANNAVGATPSTSVPAGGWGNESGSSNAGGWGSGSSAGGSGIWSTGSGSGSGTGVGAAVNWNAATRRSGTVDSWAMGGMAVLVWTVTRLLL
ncbi:hypothetical protein CI109_105508 [Kwoniella shandongensis]|uniref:Uncharacterized protein n=1 Tax=Kwoniella shandongensis TaxID=1734106 RepID=A0A5M6C2I6_9TREE|nr:uncharacterized protein CI109_002229 [Kwoniella shandongensis]KAA5529336.1 hypothetical protein CI109_002229 [Kwoniella shandongensis]